LIIHRMDLLTFINCMTFFIYLLLTVFTLFMNYKALLNQALAVFYFSLTVWCFGNIFVENPHTSWKFAVLINNITSIGWISFPVFFLCFNLVFSERKNILKMKLIYPLFFFIILVFTHRQWTNSLLITQPVKLRHGWAFSWAESVWSYLYFFYYLSFSVLSAYVLAHTMRKSENPIKKKQAGIILTVSLITLVTATTSDVVIPELNKLFATFSVPSIGHLLLLVWVGGILYSIAKYRLMTLSPSVAAEDIVKTMSDSLVLLDNDFKIIDANRSAFRLFGFSKKKLAGKCIHEVFPNAAFFEPAALERALLKSSELTQQFSFRHSDGHAILLDALASRVVDTYGQKLGVVVIFRDVTKEKEAEEKLKYVASHDMLTDLPNRALLYEHLRIAIAQARRHRWMVGVFFLDLDGFKEVNDALGHQTGDLLLMEVSAVLKKCVREYDIIARIGGDEFVVIVGDIVDLGHVEVISARVLDAFKRSFMVGGNEINITASIGVTLFPNDGESMESLLKNADVAMYSAKKMGGSTYSLFTLAMSEEVETRSLLKNDLYKALERNEFLLHYQPLIEIKTGEITVIEALLRWKHKTLGVVSPLQFIPIAEATGMIIPIGEWVLRTACEQVVELQKEGYPSVSIAVNLSVRQFKQQQLSDAIIGILNETGLDSGRLIVEITESAAMESIEHATATIGDLYRHGIKIYIDDFGMGYSSLNRLKKLPIHALKIDRAFVKNIANDPNDAAIVKAIVAMAHSLKLDVVAEGVETLEQYQFIKALKWDMNTATLCDMMQGFLFSKPVPAEELRDLFHRQRNRDFIL
jgi:diguanylate cyclase (GGDEF)-like protein/PAS domain S-box-containing protein